MSISALPSIEERLHGRVAQVAGVLNRAHAQLVELMADVIATEAWAGGGILSPTHWLMLRAGLSRARAHQIVALAERHAELPATMGAFAAGDVSLDQVTPIGRHVPTEFEASVLELARHATVPQITRAASGTDFTTPAQAQARHDAEKAAAAAEPIAPPTLTMNYTRGRFHLRYTAPADIGALVEHAVREATDAIWRDRNGLTPHPTDDDARHDTPPQHPHHGSDTPAAPAATGATGGRSTSRDHHTGSAFAPADAAAQGSSARNYSEHRPAKRNGAQHDGTQHEGKSSADVTPPSAMGCSPNLGAHDSESDHVNSNNDSGSGDGDGDGARPAAASSRQDGPDAAPEATQRAPRETVKVTLAEGFAAVATRSLAAVPSPSRRDRYRIYVHLDTAGGWLHGPSRLPQHILDKLTCDGTLQPVWETEGAPVNVGRAHRIVPERTRRLLDHRDRGCRYPGCPARGHTEKHHIIHWLHGGPSDSWNLLSLCPGHHDAHHRGEYTMTGNADLPDDHPDGMTFTSPGGSPITYRPPPPDHTPPPAGTPYVGPTGEPMISRNVVFYPTHD